MNTDTALIVLVILAALAIPWPAVFLPLTVLWIGWRIFRATR